MRRRSREEWAAIVAEFARSGESVAKFAARRRLRLSSLKWWCWRLRGASAAAAEASSEVRLVPVEVVGLAAHGGARPIELTVVGVEMRVDVGTDVTYVAALVGELRSRC
jgi:hypothetical protein